MTNNHEVNNNQPADNHERSEMLTSKASTYIVRATPEQMGTLRALAAGGFPKLWKSLSESSPLDLDALRLVLEAAKWAQVSKDEDPLDDEEQKEWNATSAAIAKIGSLLS
jgi:hypothetical protein